MEWSWIDIYTSAWSHPGMAWMCAPLTLAWILRRSPSALRTVLLVIALETVLDAWLTGALSPLTRETTPFRASELLFVIIGDLRLWWLVERFRDPTISWGAALRRGALRMMGVPIFVGACILGAGDLLSETRRIFVVYEGTYALLCAWMLLGPYLSGSSDDGRRYARELTLFFGVQYALWVLADVLLISGFAWAKGLRMVPNLLYYGLYPMLTVLRAPRENPTDAR